jgi:hypothetical protein
MMRDFWQVSQAPVSLAMGDILEEILTEGQS